MIRSPWRRSEKIVLAFVAALMLGVPPFVHELFPFSAATMFSFRHQEIAVYTVTTDDGRSLDPSRFQLQLNNPHDPPVVTFGRDGYGRQSPASVVNYDRTPSDEVLQASVRAGLEALNLDAVIVYERVFGPVDQTVRVLRERRIRVVR